MRPIALFSLIFGCTEPEKVVPDNTDLDNDGFSIVEGDCDDTVDTTNPAADDTVGDGVDNNCDGVDGVDEDGDTYANISSGGDDCDDVDPEINASADEVCDDVDNDCNGVVDDYSGADAPVWYADNDADGFGNPAVMVNACDVPSGYVADSTDCDDENALVSPVGNEVCDGLDNDCNSEVDEIDDSGAPQWYMDSDGDGFGNSASSIYACEAPSGYVSDSTDCNDSDGNVSPSQTEICDSVDNDCNGQTDEGVLVTYFADVDSDGYGDANAVTEACDGQQPSGYVLDANDCNDTSANAYPGAPEYCDTIDNNCDGTIDENSSLDTQIWYSDADGDGYGLLTSPYNSCSAPVGFVADSSDCDDSRYMVNPGVLENCATTYDDDCNGDENDENALNCLYFYVDNDQDGYGDTDGMCMCVDDPANGYTATNNLDCHDADPYTFVGAAELDNPGICMTDVDDDGYGDVNAQSPAMVGTDCDDLVSSIYPGAPDSSVDGIDQNCDQIDGQDADGDGQAAVSVGGTDCDDSDPYTYLGAGYSEASSQAPTQCMRDFDGDGFGDLTPSNGVVVAGTDCDDTDFNSNPGAVEICDGLDNDCDTVADDGLTFVDYYVDSDGDGFGDDNNLVSDCEQPSGTVLIDGDCNDSAWDVNPNGVEIDNDGVDQDCDGQDNNPTVMMADFYFEDVNPYSATFGQYYSPRDYLQEVSGWYFIHAT